jgi:predicted DNA-binding protein (UPF0278 family)
VADESATGDADYLETYRRELEGGRTVVEVLLRDGRRRQITLQTHEATQENISALAQALLLNRYRIGNRNLAGWL